MSQDNNLLGMSERLLNIENEQKNLLREQQHLKEKHEREINEIKDKQTKQDKRVGELQSDRALDRQRITAMELQLNKIDENTTYTRRQMTGILVGAVATAIIGGAVTLIYAMIGGGIM